MVSILYLTLHLHDESVAIQTNSSPLSCINLFVQQTGLHLRQGCRPNKWRLWANLQTGSLVSSEIWTEWKRYQMAVGDTEINPDK